MFSLKIENGSIVESEFFRSKIELETKRTRLEKETRNANHSFGKWKDKMTIVSDKNKLEESPTYMNNNLT